VVIMHLGFVRHSYWAQRPHPLRKLFGVFFSQHERLSRSRLRHVEIASPHDSAGEPSLQRHASSGTIAVEQTSVDCIDRRPRRCRHRARRAKIMPVRECEQLRLWWRFRRARLKVQLQQQLVAFAAAPGAHRSDRIKEALRLPILAAPVRLKQVADVRFER